jgi:hypothetical protein
MVNYLLAGMVYLLLKHFVFDFTRLQTPWMFQNKGIYGHPGGYAHALIHAVTTLPLLLFFAQSENYPFTMLLGPVLAIGWCFVVEFMVHYHMDWLKKSWCDKQNYKPDTHPQFWWWLGFDQLVHGLTYVYILYLTIRI